MIASEYSWTDDIIMDLTVRRTVQILKSIQERRKVAKLERDLAIEWQTKVLAGFIAGTVPVEKGKKNPLAAEVRNIRLVSDQIKEEFAGPEKPEADPEVFVEEGSQVAAERNKVGSWERLHQGFREVPQR
jgi:hypothetical protein